MTYEELEAKYHLNPRCGGWCPPGWLALLSKLLADLETTGFDFSRVDQIKDKFGGLRFYASPLEAQQQTLINKAEADSYRICEECGATGETYNQGGWIRTLCEQCHKGQFT